MKIIEEKTPTNLDDQKERSFDYEFSNDILLNFSEKQLKKQKIGDLEKAVDHPARGFILEKHGISGTKNDIFSDLIERKFLIINEIFERTIQQEQRQEAFDALWRLANSSVLGIDICYTIAKRLAIIADQELDKEFLEKIFNVATTNNGRDGIFAAHIAYRNGYDEDKSIIEKHLLINNYKIESIIKFAKDQSRQHGNLREFVAIDVYTKLINTLNSNDAETNQDAVAVTLLTEFNRTIDRKKRLVNLEKNKKLPAIGPEIQGLGTDSLPTLGNKNGVMFVEKSPTDYERIKELGNFFESPDKPYEFALRPSTSVYKTNLIIQTLFREGFIRSNNGSTGLDVTISGLKSSSTKYREAMALQILLLGGDYCRFDSVMDYTKYQMSWDIAIFGGFSGEKSATRARDQAEMTQVDKYDVGTELRIFALDEPDQTYKMLHLVQEIAELAIENQKATDSIPNNQDQKQAWDFLTQKANELFLQHKLPKIEDHWRYGDLKRLNDLLNSEKGEVFKNKVRTIITTARLHGNFHNQELIQQFLEESEPEIESSAEKVAKIINSCIDKYDRAIKQLSEKIQKTKLGVTATENINLVRKSALIIYPMLFFPLLVEGEVINQTKYLFTYLAMAELFANPEVYIRSIKSLGESIKTKRMVVPKDTYQRLFNYKVGFTCSAVVSLITAVFSGNPISIAWSAVGYLSIQLGEKILKRNTLIESYSQKSHN